MQCDWLWILGPWWNNRMEFLAIFHTYDLFQWYTNTGFLYLLNQVQCSDNAWPISKWNGILSPLFTVNNMLTSPVESHLLWETTWTVPSSVPIIMKIWLYHTLMLNDIMLFSLLPDRTRCSMFFGLLVLWILLFSICMARRVRLYGFDPQGKHLLLSCTME